MIVGAAFGVVAGVVAAALLAQVVLPGEVSTLRGLSRLSGQIGGASDSTTGARIAVVVVGALLASAVVGRIA